MTYSQAVHDLILLAKRLTMILLTDHFFTVYTWLQYFIDWMPNIIATSKIFIQKF